MTRLTEQLLDDDEKRINALTLSRRFETAIKMGEMAVEVFASTQNMSKRAAKRELQRRAQQDRYHPSRCMLELIQ